MLVRLANETGGRITRSTNDLTLGYARAQRDLGCQYTLGFYLRSSTAGRPSRIVVHALRPGLRVLHPDHYEFRSDDENRELQLTAAFMAPEMFQNGALRAHVFTLQPSSPSRWDALIAVSFPVNIEDSGGVAKVDFGATLLRGPGVSHAFNRQVELRSRRSSTVGERRFMFLEPASLEPGSYELRIVVADMEGRETPAAAALTVELPPIKKKDVMLVQPILGRPRASNIVVRGDGPTTGRRLDASEALAVHDIVAAKGSFEPLMIQQADQAEELLARNKACLVGRRQAPATTIKRAVSAEDGEEFELPPVPLDLEGSRRLQCQNVFEILPPETVDPGEYLFEATVVDTPADGPGRGSLRFAVEGQDSEAPVETSP